MNKTLIKKRFAKNLKSYDDNAKVQKQMAENLLKFTKNEYENILEIGCGTGLLTKLAVDKISFKSYIANDIVGECNDYIKEISPRIEFVCGDVENFLEQNDKKYDLIISNAVFQWIENIEEFITKLQSRLSPQGQLIFSTFGIENFKEIHQITGNSPSYKSIGYYESVFQKIPHTIEEEIQILNFETPKDILKHIKNTGVNALNETFWTKTDFQNFENEYKKICTENLTLTYNPIYISTK